MVGIQGEVMAKVLAFGGVRFVLAGALAWMFAVAFVGRAEAASVFSSSFAAPSVFAQPAGSSAQVVTGDRALTISWGAVKGAARYRVSWRGRVLKGGKPTAVWSKEWSGLKLFKASARSHKVTRLVNGRQFQLRLASQSKSTKSRWVVQSTLVGMPRAPAPVTTVPGTPTGVSGVAGDAEVVVSWSAPSSDGGSAITGYKVTASDGVSPSAKQCAASPCTVTGLINATAYTFSVKATNARGDSAASASSSPVAPVEQIIVASLSPKWSPEITDFTVACDQTVVVEVASQDSFSIDGAAPQSGSFSRQVPLSTGQSFEIVGATKQTVRCRPDNMDLPQTEITGSRQSAFYMVTPTRVPRFPYATIFNNQGVPVWWYEVDSGDLKLIGTNRVAYWNAAGGFHYDILTLGGSRVRRVEAIGHETDSHDLQPTFDGGFLTMSYVPRDCPITPSDCEDLSPWGGPAAANVIDGVIQKQDKDGNLLWSWNSRDHISLGESGPWIGFTDLTSRPPYDIVHLNSVEEDGNGIVFSARHLDAVYRIADPAGTGGVDWKLGGTTTPESLTAIDDPLAPTVFSGQHDARILPNGTLTVYNNGTRLGRQPRAVQYRINKNERSATLINSLRDDQVPSSFCCGGARKLPAGGWAVSWGYNNLIAEYDATGKRVFALRYPAGAWSYRVVPITDNQLLASDLRQGMDDQFPR